jgi:hypothetical protein
MRCSEMKSMPHAFSKLKTRS